ncbi:DUF1206 domain-containing protein [Myceligenerans cantabricum]
MPENSLASAAGSAADSAAGATRRAQSSRAVRALARAGYAASGVLHLLVAGLAVQLALGQPSGKADQSGALSTLSQVPGGQVLLWAVAVGFAALALWQLASAVVGVANAKGQVGARVKSVAKAVLYGVLATSSARYAQGGGGGGTSEESMTAQVLGLPGGPWLVGAGGLVIVGVGVYHVVKGLRKRFLRDLTGAGGSTVRPVVVRLGQAGYAAKGVALGVVGGLVVAAAVTADPDRAGGLDDALRTLRDQPFGQALLIAVGLGIGAYGLYSFARARFARF